MELRPYQKEIVTQGLQVLHSHRFLYLAMDCGTALLDSLGPDPTRERRILFLTDMETMGEELLKEKLEYASGQNM